MEDNVNTSLQGFTDYKLSDKERLILEVLLNPEYRTKSISDICKIAGCSRPTYYDAMAKPGFMAIYEQKTKELVKQSVGPILNTFVREALRGSFQHGKVILEMAGLYSEKSTLDINETFNVNLTVDERRTRIASLLSGKQLDSAITADFKVLSDSVSETIV